MHQNLNGKLQWFRRVHMIRDRGHNNVIVNIFFLSFVIHVTRCRGRVPRPFILASSPDLTAFQLLLIDKLLWLSGWAYGLPYSGSPGRILSWLLADTKSLILWLLILKSQFAFNSKVAQS